MERGEEDQIIAMLAETRATNYCDGVFPATDESLYRNVQFVPDYDSAAPGPVRWVRPGDFSRDPDYFKDLTSVVVPGRMNDLWLAGAMAAVAAHPDALVENIFGSSPDDFKQFGVYTCRLYKNGKWVEVVCDTRLPCAPPLGGKKVEGLKAASSPCPITARSANAAEQWIPLLEKAVAKYHGSYEALNGGDVGEALVDLTGGSTETIELAAPEIQAWVESGRLWDLLELYVADAHICTALVEDKTVSVATDGNTELPASEGTGLFPNAAYSVVMVKHIVGFDLVRLACPWSSAMETRGHWTGDWSDDSTKWDDFPEVAETLRDDGVEWERHSTDGTFWMAFSDFCRIFSKLYVCRVFPDEAFKQYCVLGEWKGKTAGGALAPSESDPEEVGCVVPKGGPGGGAGGGGGGAKKGGAARGGDGDDGPYAAQLAKRGGGAVTVDGNSSWFNNPQYQLSSDEPCSVYISLMQEDRRTTNRLKDNIGIGFEVVRMKAPGNENARAWAAGRSDLVFDSAASPVNCGGAPRREVCGSNIYLAPGYVYNVVPHTSSQGVEGSFVLRIFAQTDLRVAAIPETYSVIFPGSWEKTPDREVAGGPLLVASKSSSSSKSFKMVPNPKWCENPQFVVRLPPKFTGDQVEAKVVLRKIDTEGGPVVSKKKASARDATLGIVACKVDPAEDAASRRRQKKAGKRTNAMGEEMPTKESSLKNPRSKFLQQNQQSEAENATPARKLAISDEWCQMSDYSNTMVASMKLPPLLPSWINDGLVLVPTLSEYAAKGQYQLEVHSDSPLVVEPTPEAKACTLAGEWVEATAGGSHMAKTYKKNPRYHLRLLGQARTKVKITLSRPAGDWKEQMRKDTVGCMLGFYLVPGPSPDRRSMEEIFHDGQPWSETPFVPTNAVGTPAGFELEPLEDEVYTIVPATYESGKTGPFFLSVVSEGDFTLVKDSGKEKGAFSFGKR